MKKLRNFKCQSGAIIERLVVDGITIVRCECGCEAKKSVTAARCFNNSATCPGKSPSL